MKSARAAVSESIYPRIASAAMAPGHAHGPLQADYAHQRPTSRTITGLRRWSVANKKIPAVPQVKAIHVYDFDNTLFLSPLPNPQLWNGPTIGFLQSYESFTNGGWWHDPNLLAATGYGMDVEERRAWAGWWNEDIVKLVTLSMQQKDVVTVLLTGRSESQFASIIKRMVESKGLDFDLICLKPEVGPNGERINSTMNFKQTFFEDLVLTYNQADEIRVYEDRVRHVKSFRDFFEQLNKGFQSVEAGERKPINAEVIQVADECTFLSPVTEVAEVQRMINSHNLKYKDPALNVSKSPYGRLRIKRTVFYTAYLISNTDSARLINGLLSPLLPAGLAESNDLKYMANSILITPRPAPRSMLDKIGGMGKKLSWQVTGTASFENRVWAARLSPVPATESYYTDNPVPIMVLAVRKGARPIDAAKIQNWHPVPTDRAVTFETVIGEKVVLRVEEDNPREGEWESQFLHKNSNSRKRPRQDRDEDILYPQYREDGPGPDYPSRPRPPPHHHRHGGDHNNNNNNTNNHNRYYDDAPPRRGSGRGGRGRGSGRGRGNQYGRGGGGRGRGRGRDAGPPPGYRSLDDYGSGYDGGYEERSGPRNGPPVMNY